MTCPSASTYSSSSIRSSPRSAHRWPTSGSIASFNAASTMLDGIRPSASTIPASARGSKSVATCSSPSSHRWPMSTTRLPSRVRPDCVTRSYDSSYFSRPFGVSTKSLLHLLVGWSRPHTLQDLAFLSAQYRSNGRSCYPDSGEVAGHCCGFPPKVGRSLALPPKSTKTAGVVATPGPSATAHVYHRSADRPDWQWWQPAAASDFVPDGANSAES
eukprot:3500660-Pleurochrysis_carterae.AAC.1